MFSSPFSGDKFLAANTQDKLTTAEVEFSSPFSGDKFLAEAVGVSGVLSAGRSRLLLAEISF